jgi:two-component sensor histidine kinase
VRLSNTLFASILISLIQAVAFATSIHLFSPENLSAEAPSFAFTTFLFTLLPALLGMGLFNLRGNLESEARITNEIAENISIIKRELWSLHKKFAREIHGGLQSKLQILSLKFERDGGDRAQLVESIHSELSTLLTTDSSKPRIENFKNFINELIEFWDGIAQISSNISQEAYDLISNDYLLAECLHEVIREAVNNAVKHSGASQISIFLKSAEQSALLLLVENNLSKKIKAPTNKNLGTSIYKELAHSWELKLHLDRVIFSASFIINHQE